MQALEGELQAEATRQQQTVAELRAQLAQKEQAAEHYKGQVKLGVGVEWACPHCPCVPGRNIP